MKAWLVTWDWSGDAAAVADEVLAILNPRWSVQRVSQCVELLYAVNTSCLGELATYARWRERNPYKAEEFEGEKIACGHHPYLYARKVSDLIVETDPLTDLEIISWVEPDIYKLTDSGFELVGSGRRNSFSRRIDGPPSSELIWDRLLGRFKPGWGEGETPNSES